MSYIKRCCTAQLLRAPRSKYWKSTMECSSHPEAKKTQQKPTQKNPADNNMIRHQFLNNQCKKDG